MNNAFGRWRGFGNFGDEMPSDWDPGWSSKSYTYYEDTPLGLDDNGGSTKFQTTLDQISAAVQTLAPVGIGIASSLIERRQNSLSGLYQQRSKLQEDIAGETNAYQNTALMAELDHVNRQIRIL